MIVPRLDELLNTLPNVRVGVLGDFCLDVYWTLDTSASETSVETGLPTRPVRDQRYELGGAGTIVKNLITMGVGTVEAFGVIGDDPFGREMKRLMEEKKVGHDGVLSQLANWETMAFIKPISEGQEENRIDFGNFNLLEEEIGKGLLAKLEARLTSLDIVIINQQLLRGIHTKFFQTSLQQRISSHPNIIFLVDCRHIAGTYDGCLNRLNEHEAARLCKESREETEAIAKKLYDRWRKPVFLSRSERGVLVADRAGVHAIPGLHIVGAIDSVGAGDSMLAGIAAALAVGRPPVEAATFGNFVSGVTVQKLFQTGTASPDEIRAIGTMPDYNYEPELADDPKQARYFKGTEIEIVGELPKPLKITHAIFDYDGTLSTIRQGWEQVMEEVMMHAILGADAKSDKDLYKQVVVRVRDYIDKTTGLQTLTQMQGLTKMVEEFARIPKKQILNAAVYKETYNTALLKMIAGRIEKLKAGKIQLDEVLIKGVVGFLEELQKAGVMLYLASGTDQADLITECEALGVARFFKGHIYGSVGDMANEVKRVALDKIIKEIGVENAGRLAAFGDGPVELRETRKRGGVAVGIASDEVKREGLNLAKRGRLIRAGAQLVIPDFSQTEELLTLLGVR